jgi:hypothetical protein
MVVGADGEIMRRIAAPDGWGRKYPTMDWHRRKF